MAMLARPLILNQTECAAECAAVYFRTEREPVEAPRAPLPVALGLGVLYDRILSALIPTPAGA